MSASNFRPLFLACLAVLAGGSLALSACKPRPAQDAPAATSSESQAPSYAAAHAGDYAVVPLKADLARFDENTRRMIAKLVQAAEIMNELTWKQSWDGDRAALLAQAPDEATRQLVDINFGPWDRLNEDTPFIQGIKPRPPGGPFYPVDMTKDEFEAADLPDKKSNYTLLRRDAGRQAHHGAVSRRIQGRTRTHRHPAARGGGAQRRQERSPITCGCAPTRCSATTSVPAIWPGWR